MKRLHNFSDSPSIIDHYMWQLRDVQIQKDRDRFRENVRRIGRVIGYEISKHLNYKEHSIQTPLAQKMQRVLDDNVVSITILRAGLPLHEGILGAIPMAENGFISAYRKHDDSGDFNIEIGYVACPDLTDKVLILNDPMLATGSSFVNALEALKPYGKPKSVHIAAVIASQDGVDNLMNTLPSDICFWIGAIDPELDHKKYIVPGLGDAGDLAFGEKMQS